MASPPESAAHGYVRVFDEIAADYDRHRPAYPDELVDRTCQAARVRTGDLVLEVGCGTGQLTRSLAGRGLRVLALEPGTNLISLARQNLQEAAEVEFANARFEDAPLPHGRFRAVFSASAFHWVDPEVGWQRAADVLVPGGTLALVQYFGLAEARSKQDEDAVLAAIRTVVPDAAAAWPAYRDLDTTLAGIERHRGNISRAWSWLGGYDIGRDCAGRLFGDVQAAVMPTLTEHTPGELGALLRTLSFCARLSPGQRQALHRELEAVHRRLGRPVRASTIAVLLTAHRREGPGWSEDSNDGRTLYPGRSQDRARRAGGRSHRAARDAQVEISHPHSVLQPARRGATGTGWAAGTAPVHRGRMS